METNMHKSHEMFDVEPEFMSLVDRPANKRAFLLMKSDRPDTQRFERQARFVKTESVGEVHYVTGIAYEPGVPDTDDEYMTAETVEKAAHHFMKAHGRVDKQHDWTPDKDCDVVESWIAHEDTTINGQTVKAGTWLVKAEIRSPETWGKIASGEIGGFSIGGYAKVAEEDTVARKADSSLVKQILDGIREMFAQKEKVVKEDDESMTQKEIEAIVNGITGGIVPAVEAAIAKSSSTITEERIAEIAAKAAVAVAKAAEEKPVNGKKPTDEEDEDKKDTDMADVKKQLKEMKSMIESFTPVSSADAMNERGAQSATVKKSDNPYAAFGELFSHN